MKVVIFGKYDSKFVLVDAILVASLHSTFIKWLLNFSAMVLLSVMFFCYLFLYLPIITFAIFHVLLLLFSYCLVYFESSVFWAAILVFEQVLIHFIRFLVPFITAFNKDEDALNV